MANQQLVNTGLMGERYSNVMCDQMANQGIVYITQVLIILCWEVSWQPIYSSVYNSMYVSKYSKH